MASSIAEIKFNNHIHMRQKLLGNSKDICRYQITAEMFQTGAVTLRHEIRKSINSTSNREWALEWDLLLYFF